MDHGHSCYAEKDPWVQAAGDEVVELALLLTRRQVAMLEQMARFKGQSLAQVIRDMIRLGIQTSRDSVIKH
jgi:hypothetical protein